MMQNKKCKICGKRHFAKGLCKKHYSRAYYQRPKVKERVRAKWKAKIQQERDRKLENIRRLEEAKKYNRKVRLKEMREILLLFKPKVQKALILDGVLLEKELSERGIR